MKSIRMKVFSAILLTTLTTALAVTLLSYRKSAGMIEEDYTAALRQETARIAETIDRMFLDTYHTHIHAACDPELQRELLAYLVEMEDVRLERCAALLRTFCSRNTSISSLYLLIPEAGVLVTSEDYPVYKKCVPAESMEAAVRLAEAAGGPEPLADLAHQASASVSFAAAVEDAGGTARGYLVTNIKERTLYYDYIAELGSGAVKEAVLLDRNGGTVTSLGAADSSRHAAWL
ncbi:MAG: hypothetical protein K2L38_12295, partial [Dysosmobacter sp.]|nr:hypothetical protein [Dysosmobacter sp.]